MRVYKKNNKSKNTIEEVSQRTRTGPHRKLFTAEENQNVSVQEKKLEHTGELIGEQAGTASQRPTMTTVPYKKGQEQNIKWQYMCMEHAVSMGKDSLRYVS